MKRGKKMMKKEYRAMIQHRNYRTGQWLLAVPNVRTYKTREEAEQAIKKCIEEYKPHLIDVLTSSGYEKQVYNDLEVIDYKIESRLVSDWETD